MDSIWHIVGICTTHFPTAEGRTTLLIHFTQVAAARRVRKEQHSGHNARRSCFLSSFVRKNDSHISADLICSDPVPFVDSYWRSAHRSTLPFLIGMRKGEVHLISISQLSFASKTLTFFYVSQLG